MQISGALVKYLFYLSENYKPAKFEIQKRLIRFINLSKDEVSINNWFDCFELYNEVQEIIFNSSGYSGLVIAIRNMMSYINERYPLLINIYESFDEALCNINNEYNIIIRGDEGSYWKYKKLGKYEGILSVNTKIMTASEHGLIYGILDIYKLDGEIINIKSKDKGYDYNKYLIKI